MEPPADAIAWAAEVLDSPEGRAVKNGVEAARLFRHRKSRLLLGPALFLAKHALHPR